MGFFEFFRRGKKVESKTVRKISLVELSYEIEKLSNKLKNKTKIIKEDINKNLDLMSEDLRAQINILKSINLEQRREDERIKRIVLENLGFYIIHLEELIERLEKTNNLKAEDYISKIQFILEYFYKKSFKSYEKTTILIGKEIEHAKEIIKNFNKDFIKIVRENDFVFTKINSINEFRELDNKIESLDRVKESINKQIKVLEELKRKLEKQKSLFEENYCKFKQSEEFNELLLQEQKFNEELINFNNEIRMIKEKINIKYLLKYHHHNIKYNELIKNYRESFIETLENDESLEIVKLVEEALNINMKKEILDLKEKNKNLVIRNNKPCQTKVRIFEDKIKNSELEIADLKEKELKEVKKFQKFDKKHASLIDEKINKAKDIFGNIEIVDLM